MRRHDFARGCVEVPGTRVVSEAVPRLAHRVSRRCREVLERRVAGEKAGEEVDDAPNLRLLQHHLGDQDGVGVGHPPPGELSGVARIPGQQAAAEGSAPRRQAAGILLLTRTESR